MPRRPPLPNKLALPGGYVVTIRLASPTEIAEEVEAEPHDVGGCWDDSEREILIDKTLPAGYRWYVLAHELQHALLDYQHWLINEGIARTP